MRESLNLAQIRQRQLEMLDIFDDFCTTRGIKYSLSGGSLLGAVRHKGFIPWDDDVDLMMPRPEYERFLASFNKENVDIKAINYRVDPDFPRPFTKITDLGTRIAARNGINKYGIFLDLFPVDGQPDNEEETSEYVAEYERLNRLFYKKTPLYRMSDNLLVKIKSAIRGPFFPPREETMSKIKSLLQRYPFGSTGFAGAIMGGSKMGTHVPDRVFKEFTRMEFEGRSISCIKDYDTYLTRMYGDYMTPPPPRKQKTNHFAAVYRV